MWTSLLATQWDPQNDWTATPNLVNNDVAQVLTSCHMLVLVVWHTWFYVFSMGCSHRPHCQIILHMLIQCFIADFVWSSQPMSKPLPLFQRMPHLIKCGRPACLYWSLLPPHLPLTWKSPQSHPSIENIGVQYSMCKFFFLLWYLKYWLIDWLILLEAQQAKNAYLQGIPDTNIKGD